MRIKPLASNLCKGRKISDIILKNEKEKKRKRGTHNTGYYFFVTHLPEGRISFGDRSKSGTFLVIISQTRMAL